MVFFVGVKNGVIKGLWEGDLGGRTKDLREEPMSNTINFFIFFVHSQLGLIVSFSDIVASQVKVS